MKQDLLVADQVPSYVRADYPTFVEFVEAYYKWFDEQYSLKKFDELVDLDTTIDEFLVYFKKQYDVFNVLQGIDNRFYLRHLKELYSAKGSEEAIKYFFRIKYGEQSDVRLPWEDVLKVSDGKWFQETGTIVRVRFGDLTQLQGQFVNLIDQSGLKFKTSIKNISQRVNNVYEIQISRFSCGKRRFVTVESLDRSVVADILLTITSANVEKGRGGRNFRIGQVFSIRGTDGSESLLKVKSVTGQGTITAIDVFGFGYEFVKDFNIIVAPFDEKPEIGPNIQIIVTSDEGSGSYTFETDDNISAKREAGTILNHNYTNVPGNVAVSELLPGGTYLISSIGNTNFKELVEPVYINYSILDITVGQDQVITITIDTQNHKITLGEKIIVSSYTENGGSFVDVVVVTEINDDQIIAGFLNGNPQVVNQDGSAITSDSAITYIHYPYEINEQFVAKKQGAGTGKAIQVYGPPTSIEYVTNNVFYTVDTPGTTNFELVGGPQTGYTDFIVVDSNGVDTATNSLTPVDNQPHGFETGDPIRFYSATSPVGSVMGNYDIILNQVYYAIVVDEYSFKIAPTEQDAIDGTPISLYDPGYEGQFYVFSKEQTNVPLIFTNQNVLDSIQTYNEIFYVNHGLQRGDPIQYVRGNNSFDEDFHDTPFFGLEYNKTYYAIPSQSSGEDYFLLAASYEDAITRNPIDLKNLYNGVQSLPAKFDYFIPTKNISGVVFQAKFPNPDNLPIPVNPLTGSGTIKQTMFNKIDEHGSSLMLPNNVYKILSVGTTDFTSAGALSNTVGQYFIASGQTAGTGTVEVLRQITYVYDLTYVGEIVGKIIERQGFKKQETDFAYIRCRVGCVYQYPGFYLKSDSIVGDTGYLQDSDFYQVYSYLVTVERIFNEYSDTLKKAFHPAGTKLFGDFAVSNTFQLDPSASSSVNLISKRDIIIDYVNFVEIISKLIHKTIPRSFNSGNVENNIITLENHGFETCDEFIYIEKQAIEQSPEVIPGLVNGQTYWLKVFPTSDEELIYYDELYPYDPAGETRYGIAETFADLQNNNYIEIGALELNNNNHIFNIIDSSDYQYKESYPDVEWNVTIDPRPWPVGNVVTDWDETLTPGYTWNEFYSPLGNSVFTSTSGIRITSEAALDYESKTYSGNYTPFNYAQIEYTAGQSISIPGFSIEGLISGTTYYVIKVNDNQFKLAETCEQAMNDQSIVIGAVTGEIPVYLDVIKPVDSISFRSEFMKLSVTQDNVDPSDQLTFLTWKNNVKIRLDKYDDTVNIGQYGGLYWEPHYVELVPAYWQAGYLVNEKAFTV